MSEPSTDVALPAEIRAAGAGKYTVPITFSEEYLRALLTEGLKMEPGTRISLLKTGDELSLFFSPVLPLLVCKECGYVGDTSDSATFVDEEGETRNAFMEDGYAVRCQNEECSRHGVITIVPRRTVLKNAKLYERPKGEF